MDFRTLLIQLYQDFNSRQIDAVLAHMHPEVRWPNGWEGGYVSGHEQVRAYWLRQWQQIDPIVEPISFDLQPDGRVAIKVHQIIKSLEGQILSDTLLLHIYTFVNGKVQTMAIEH
jgi:hypothetical protein